MPLHIHLNDLAERLQIFSQEPLIKRVNSQLQPGENPGESILTVEVSEKIPYSIDLNINNHRSPSIGAYQSELRLAHNNLFGRADSLVANYNVTDGLDDYGLAYSLPFNSYMTAIEFNYSRAESDVVEDPFDTLDISSRQKNYAIGLRQPIVNSTRKSLNMSVFFEMRESDTYLFNRPFSFSAGADNGKTKVTVIRYILDWKKQLLGEVFAIRSSISKGLGAFRPTQHREAPDSHFFHWLGQFQWAKRFGESNNEMIFRTDFQRASRTLLALEKFSIGGHASVRGYREGEIVRDSGVTSSVELRYPIFHDDSIGSLLQLAIFSDWGRGWNSGRVNAEAKNIASIGTGLRWNPMRSWYLELYGAIPLNHVEQDKEDIQDYGFHFQVNYKAL